MSELRSCSFRNGGRNVKHAAKPAGTYGKWCPSFVGPKMNRAATSCQLFCPLQACSVLLCSCLELPTSYAPSGQHPSPLPHSLAFVSAAITSSDLYQAEELVLTPKRDTSSHTKNCYISSSHVWNNVWVCAADPGETINQRRMPKSKGNGLSYF